MYPVNLLFYGQPYKLPPLWYDTLGDFLRSDHVPFWNNDPSMSAIFLSDTADHRSYMVSCYHQDCDNINRVTSEMLQFLQKTSDSIVAVANDVTKLSCPESGTIIHSYSDNSGILYIEYKGSPIGLSRYGISLILTSGFGILRQNRQDSGLKVRVGGGIVNIAPGTTGLLEILDRDYWGLKNAIGDPQYSEESCFFDSSFLNILFSLMRKSFRHCSSCS